MAVVSSQELASMNDYIATEAWPKVIFDVGVGQLATNIEVDIQYIANTLAGGGMTDEQITATTLYFTDQTIIREEGSDNPTLNWGDYDHETHTARVHLGTLEYHISGRGYLDDDQDISQEVLNLLANSDATEHTLHELHHELEASTIGKAALDVEELAYLGIKTKPSLITRLAMRAIRWGSITDESREMLQELVGDLEASSARTREEKSAHAMASETVYLDSPAEKRAREFSERIVESIIDDDRNFPVQVEFR